MPNLPWPKHRDEPVTGDPSLAALLAWAEFPPGSAPEMRPVGEVLAALTAGPTDDELAGEAAALAAYRSRGGAPRPATRARRRTRRPLLPLLSARAAATVAAAAAVLIFSVFATAAYTQVLPAPVQRLAHAIIGAPAAGGGPGTGPSPVGSGTVGPGATGSGWNRPGRGDANRPGAPVSDAARHQPADSAGLRRAERRADATGLRYTDPDAHKNQGQAELAPDTRERERERQREREWTGTGTATARRPRSHDIALTRSPARPCRVTAAAARM